MTSPTVARSSSYQGADGTSHSIPLGSYVSGDYVLVILTADANPTFSDPAGWDAISSREIGGPAGASGCVYAAYGIDADDLASATHLSLSLSSAQEVRASVSHWEDVDLTDPIAVAISRTAHASTQNNGIAPDIACPDDSTVIQGLVWDDDRENGTGGGSLTLLDNGKSNDSATGNGVGLHVRYKSIPTAAQSGTTTFNISTSEECEAFSFALQGVAASGPAITDIDTDESVTSTQTNVVITGTGFSSATVEFRQGAVTLAQSIDSQNETTIQIDVVFSPGAPGNGPHLKYGDATAAVINGDDQEDTQAITMAVPTGYAYVDLTTPNASADYRITAVADLESGDQLEISNVQGGTIADVTVNADATFEAEDAVTAFDVRAWDADNQTWGAVGTQTVGDPIDPEPLPEFSGTIPNQEYTEDVAITSLDTSTYFTDAASYALTGTLPTGLSFATDTGILSGTPTQVGTFSGLVVTGTNTSGSADSNTFQITVAEVVTFTSATGRKRDRRRRGFLLPLRGRG